MRRGEPYNIALIGAGRMGARWAKVISESTGCSLALVSDRDAALAKRIAGLYGADFSADQNAVFDSDVSAVVIVTPHAFLYPLAKKALLSGKHVFVEKPGSTTADEMRELTRIANDKKLMLIVGFNYRFFDSVRKAKHIVEGGGIGEVVSLRIVHGHPGRPGYEKEWRMQKRLSGGGVLMDQGLHVIDLARWFLGEPATRVNGVTSNFSWKAEVEDAAFVLLETKQKKLASLSVSISEWEPVFSCHITGKKGYIFIPGLGRKYGIGDRFEIGLYDRKTGRLEKRSVPCNPDADAALSLEFKAFIGALSGENGAESNASDAAEALALIEQVYTSGQ